VEHRRKDTYVILMCCLLVVTLLTGIFSFGGCGGNNSGGSSDSQSIRMMAKRLYYEYQLNLYNTSPTKVLDKPHIYDPRAYPSEAATSMLSAYINTGDNRYKEAAIRQLAYGHSHENADHLLVADGYTMIAAHYQARLIIGYYVAYQILNDPVYLDWADAALDGLLSLSTAQITVLGRTFNIFNYTYDMTPPYAPNSGVRIDPNQDASYGLSMTLLYHDKQSRHYHHPGLKDKALEMLDASVILQDAQGRMPLLDGSPDMTDTSYAGFCYMQVAWANRFWNEKRYSDCLTKAIQWFNELNKANITIRFYPIIRIGELDDTGEAYFRLAVCYFYQGDIQSNQALLDSLWEKWDLFKDIPGGWVDSTAYLVAMGIPKAQAN
jgi:hypothetical protein